MPTYSSFAIVGAGGIGTLIAKALLEKGVKVVVFTRGSSKKVFPLGVVVEEVNYESQEAIQAVLVKHSIEVIISTLSFAGFVHQNRIADAAQSSGVKLFVPSEFGMPSGGGTEGMLGLKETFARYLKAIGVPSARFYVGYFTGEIPWLTGYSTNGKINVLGSGGHPVSFTAEEDIAGFVAHVLTEQPADVIRDKVFRIQGDRLTLDELAPLFKTKVAYVESVPGRHSEVVDMLHQHIDRGLGSTGWDIQSGGEGSDPAGSSNGLWAGHVWKTVKDVHGL